MSIQVFCGFPGVGKSTLFRSIQNRLRHTQEIPDTSVVDFDTNGYRTDPNYPSNYVDGLCELLPHVNVIFTMAERGIVDALTQQQITHYLIYPHPTLRNEYLERYIDRGDSLPSIRFFRDQWESLLDNLRRVRHPYSIPVELGRGETLRDRFYFNGVMLELR